MTPRGGAYEAAASGADAGGRLYADFRSAAVEYVSEKLFGGNPAYDEGAGVVNKLVSMIPNTDGLVSFLSSTPVEILSEGLEEMLSDVLNPAIDLIATGKADWPSVQQVLEDAATGVLLAGMSQGVNAAGNAISTKVTTAPVEQAADNDYLRQPDIQIGRSLGAKARNYEVLDKKTGLIYHFVEGSHLQNVQVFAGAGNRNPLHTEVVDGLVEEFGGKCENWQHAKGKGLLTRDDMESREAEIHWFQEKSVGKVKFKVKEWLDEN